MKFNKTLYTLGDIGDTSEIAELINNDACEWLYFVYKTDTVPLNIGTLQRLRQEKSEEIIVIGIASSRRLARKLLLHIVTKALSFDSEIANGLAKMTQ